MLLALSSALFALSIGLFAFFVAEVAAPERRLLARRLNQIGQAGSSKMAGAARAKSWFSKMVVRIGDIVRGTEAQRALLRQRLYQAGYRSANAVAMYWGGRLVFSLGLGMFGFSTTSLLGASTAGTLVMTIWLGLIGWLLPSMYLGQKKRARDREIQSALPDTLDLLVVCVDAGLGLNQAWVRISEDIGSVSKAMAEELALVNLQIRAGVPREEAMRNLGTRTESADLRSLAAILVQTDRFGTSVSTALRVQADALRNKRRNRAEEAAAKTPVKLSFPLVMCIMPTLFAVVLGGAILEIIKGFSGF